MSPLRLIIVLLFMLMMKQGGAQNNVSNFRVYPNPFCDVAHIEFDLATNDSISLVVCNIWGSIERPLFSNIPLPSGSYSINFNGDSLPDGMYLIKLASLDSHAIGLKRIKVTCTSTGLNKLTPSPKLITLYPNPTSNLVSIDIEGEKIITITNLLGQICKTITTVGQTISIADLPNGSYVATVLSPLRQPIAVGKILKEN